MGFQSPIKVSLLFVPMFLSFSFVTAKTELKRIITDIDTMLQLDGLPVEYWYNETSTMENGNHLGSVPGCPESIDEFPWIYFGEPPKCFLSGTRGPCRGEELLMPRLGSTFGVCICYCLLEENYHHLIENQDENLQRFLYCRDWNSGIAPFGQVFDTQDKQCYNLFVGDDTAPCEDGTFITDSEKDSLTCLPICDRKERNWRSMRDAGLCVNLPVKQRGSIRSLERNTNCENFKRYSHPLKKCVETSRVTFIPG